MSRTNEDAWGELNEALEDAPNDVRFLFAYAFADLQDRDVVSTEELDNFRERVESETEARRATTESVYWERRLKVIRVDQPTG